MEAVEEILDTYKERLRNPIIGAYVISLVTYNWKLVYSVFNFDDNFNMEDKIKFIDAYFVDHQIDLYCLKISTVFVYPIFFSLLSVIIFIGLSLVSGLLFDFSRNVLKVKLSKLAKFRTVPENVYDELDQKYVSVLEERDSIKSKLTNATEDRDKLSKELIPLRSEHTNLLLKTSEERDRLEKKIRELESKLSFAVDPREKIPWIDSEDFEGKSLVEIFSTNPWDFYTDLISWKNEPSSNHTIHMDDNFLYINGNLTYRLDNCRYNRKEGLVYFEKHNVNNGDLPIRCFLVKTDLDEFKGYELVPGSDNIRWAMATYKLRKITREDMKSLLEND